MAQLSGLLRMQNDDSLGSSNPRKSCERCRSHKLKCTRSLSRSNLSGSQCDRCAKAGLDCHTHTALPPGRPRLERDTTSPARLSTKRKATDQRSSLSGPESHSGAARIFRPPSPIAPPTPAQHEAFLATVEDTSIDAMNVLCSTTPFDYPNTLAIDPNLSINAIGGIDPGSGNWTNISQIPNLIFPPPIDKKRYYLDKLADLNCTLLKYVADTNSSSPAEASITHEEASVGQVLEFLEEFHGILKYYLLTIPIRSAPRLSGSDPEDTDYDSEPDFAENGTAAGQPLISLVTESHEARGMDYPTVLAISTCYVSLVRLCRSWLQNMTAILEESDHRTKHHTTASQSHHLGNLEGQDCRPSSAFSGHPVSNIPHVLPGVQLGGFQLGNYRSLQISVFMQVSMDLLWRIERAVAALVATDSIGLPASSKNLSTIKTMLQQEARASHRTTPRQQQRKPKDQGAIGVQSLMVLVRTVRKSLRGNVCLQLEEGSLDWDDFVL